MSLLDPKGKYTNSTATDIRKTFAKARRKLAEDKARRTPNAPEPKVAQLLPASAAAEIFRSEAIRHQGSAV